MEEKQPSGDFCTTKWEKRLRTQEEEIMLLKSALSDVLRRICVLEHQIPPETHGDSSLKVKNVTDICKSSQVSSDPLTPIIPPRTSVGTQTEWAIEHTGSIESIDTGEGHGVSENESLNGGVTDGIGDLDGPREFEQLSQSQEPDEAAANARTVHAVKPTKNELFHRSSTSDKLVKDAKEKVKKLERKSVSSTNLLGGKKVYEKGATR